MEEPNITPDGTQQPPAPTATHGADPAANQGADWEKKYKGMITVLADKDKKIGELDGKVSTLAKTIEDLQSAGTQSTAGWDAQRLNYETQITEKATALDTASKELESLKGYKLKMDAIKEFPDLLPIADSIPAMPNEELMKSHLEALQKGLDGVAERKAQALTAGLTPGPVHGTPAKYAYTTQQEWDKVLMDKAGTPEYQEVDEAYMGWFNARYK